MRVLDRATLACVIALAACGPKALAPLPPPGPPGQREKAMTNCPSAVIGAKTVFGFIGGGLTLEITAPEASGTAEIRARADLHAAMGEPATTGPAHTGKHAGPGDVGHCPIIHLGTTVTVEPIFGGARLTVLARDPAMVQALQRDTRARLAWFDPTTPTAAP